jgi:hypothetical protein
MAVLILSLICYGEGPGSRWVLGWCCVLRTTYYVRGGSTLDIDKLLLLPSAWGTGLIRFTITTHYRSITTHYHPLPRITTQYHA